MANIKGISVIFNQIEITGDRRYERLDIQTVDAYTFTNAKS